MKTITIALTTEEENDQMITDDLIQGIRDCAGEYKLQCIVIEAMGNED